MPITNKFNLPQPIVEALKRKTYDPGHGDFSATELIAAPKIKALSKRHKEEIFEDASDMLYSLYGQAMHYILERAGVKAQGYAVEQRHYAKYGRWNVSAQFDCMFLDGGILSDYKFTTTYAFQKNMDGSVEMKKEWFAQLNMQADILHRNPQLGIKVEHLQIVGLLRDWQPSKAAKDPLYPQSQIVIMPIPMVSSDRVEKYVLERCTLHQAARDEANDDLIPECSKEDRLEDETEYAAMKAGGKRATKVFASKPEAEAWIGSQNDAAKFEIQMRPGFARRCMGVAGKVYCPAAKFCHHHRMLVSTMQNKEI